MEFAKVFSLGTNKVVLAVVVLGLLVSSVACFPAGHTGTASVAQTQSSEQTKGETLKDGMNVLKDYVNVHLYRIPALPTKSEDEVLYKAMYSLSLMEQYVRLIGTLNLSSARLDFLAIVMDQILSDSCEWINSINPSNETRTFPSIDCSDPADFIPTVLALGLKPYVEDSSLYLTNRYSSANNNPDNWIESTFEDSEDRCEFCAISDDLKSAKSPCIAALRSLFHSKCLPWLRSVTGIGLTDNIDMTCSKYEYTDTLLCHDDELEGRRIAFIYYLVPDWSIEDGGLLDLFDVDVSGQPRGVVKSLRPAHNNFIFFEVNAVSFHQVSEVLSADKVRLSVNGWFHGPPVTRPTAVVEVAPAMNSLLMLSLDRLSEWINPTYLDIGVQTRIQHQFESDSQIELPGFLVDEKYELLCEEFENCQFKARGPPNKRCVHIADSAHYPVVTALFLQVVQSEPFCRLLAHMTGLELAQNLIRLSEQEIEAMSANDTTTSTTLTADVGSATLSLEGGTASCSNQTSRGSASGSGSDQPASSPSLSTSDEIGVALCRCGLYNWRPGDYTLVRDSDSELGEFALDALLFFKCEGWSTDSGGVVSYIARDEDEELLSVSPTANSLSLIYRDQASLHFTKYINHRARCHANTGCYYTMEAVYKENAPANS